MIESIPDVAPATVFAATARCLFVFDGNDEF
jgi:hypothetical protein